MTTVVPEKSKIYPARDDAAESDDAVLDVAGVTVEYPTPQGPFRAVDGFSLKLSPGERVAIVGESGSGKTNACMAIAGFLGPEARVTADRMLFGGRDLLARKATALPRRSPGMSVVFQDAMTSLDPVWTIGSQLRSVIRTTNKAGRKEATELAAGWLRKVGLDDTERVLSARPYELSGGMRQRVMIALALSGQPRLLLADEPTSALDATLSRELMELLVALADEFGTSLLLVSHDILLCREFTDRTVVMYGGRIVEEQSSRHLAEQATHPYTRGLLACVPTFETALLDELPTMNTYVAEPAGRAAG
jgi:peptide/nickel transport system ATP-binding protein